MKIRLTNCIKKIDHIGLGVVHELQNCHKMPHPVTIGERRASLDEVIPNSSPLKEVSRPFVRLGEPQVEQKPLYQFRCLSEHLLCLTVANNLLNEGHL